MSPLLLSCDPETVMQDSCVTFGDPAEMTNDQLADIVIEGVKKFRQYLPCVRSLKERFDTGDRDSTNRLKTPIKDCHSWKEFCETHLDRTPEAVRQALADKKLPKVTSPVTDAEFAEYEQNHPTVRASTVNMITQGVPPTDVISALRGMDVPNRMAEAAVRIVLSPTQETPSQPKNLELTAAVSQHIAKVRELQTLFQNDEASRGSRTDLFHVLIRDLTETQVKAVAVIRTLPEAQLEDIAKQYGGR